MSLQTLIQYFDILGHSRPSSPGSAPAILSGSVPVMLSGGGSPHLVDLPGWISSGSVPALLRSRPIVLSPGRSIPAGELLQSSRFSHFPEMINYKSAIHYRPGNRVSCYHNKKRTGASASIHNDHNLRRAVPGLTICNFLDDSQQIHNKTPFLSIIKGPKH